MSGPDYDRMEQDELTAERISELERACGDALRELDGFLQWGQGSAWDLVKARRVLARALRLPERLGSGL